MIQTREIAKLNIDQLPARAQIAAALASIDEFHAVAARNSGRERFAESVSLSAVKIMPVLETALKTLMESFDNN